MMQFRYLVKHDNKCLVRQHNFVKICRNIYELYYSGLEIKLAYLQNVSEN